MINFGYIFFVILERNLISRDLMGFLNIEKIKNSWRSLLRSSIIRKVPVYEEIQIPLQNLKHKWSCIIELPLIRKAPVYEQILNPLESRIRERQLYTNYICWSHTENFIKFRERIILHVMRKQFDFGQIKHPMGEVIRATVLSNFIHIYLVCHGTESYDVIQSPPNFVGDFRWMRQRSIQNLVRIWQLVVDL